MPEEKLETIDFDDQELFDQANADDPVEDQPEVEQVEEQTEQVAAKDEPEAQETTATERPAVDDNAPQVPSWRVREINEEKRVLADKNAALETERSQWQREQQELRQKLAEKEAPTQQSTAVDEPDPLIDPKAYREHIQKQVREEMLNDRRETSLQSAHRTYGKEFEEAYATAQQKIDPSLKSLMQNSRDPGETLIKWHREQKLLQEVGTDPNSWREKEAERLLNDPAFLEKAIAKAASAAQQQQPSGGKPAIRLPPSLSGATRATTHPETLSDDDMSDEALWDHANA